VEARQIEYFLRVAELGSINRAAADLRMSQPSLSRWLAILEREAGASLLVRTSKGIRLTDAGELLAERARPILRQLEVLRGDLHKRASSQFNLAMPFSLQALVTAPFAEEIIRTSPDVSLRVYEGINNAIRVWMENGVVDAAVMASNERAPETYEVKPLLTEQMLLVGDRRSGLRIDEPVPLSRLEIAYLILPGRPNVVSTHVEEAMRRAGCRYSNRLEVETLSLCLELTRRGLGYTVMPYSALHGKLGAQGELRVALIAGLTVTWQLYVNRARSYAISTRQITGMLNDHIAATIESGVWRFAQRAPVTRERARTQSVRLRTPAAAGAPKRIRRR
jgi:LysR family nitrogen assimilation transcriptional regulator